MMFEKINNASVWYGPEQEKKDDWVYNLDKDDISEINYLTEKYLSTNRELKEINKKDFYLENLQQKYLNKIDLELKNGRGFALI